LARRKKLQDLAITWLLLWWIFGFLFIVIVAKSVGMILDLVMPQTTHDNASGTIESSATVDVSAQVAGRITSFGMVINGMTIDYRLMVTGAMLETIDDSIYSVELSDPGLVN
jgi:hypothetical protein